MILSEKNPLLNFNLDSRDNSTSNIICKSQGPKIQQLTAIA